MLSRRTFLSSAVLTLPAVALVSSPVWAETPPVYASNGVAINGFDPVAYFTDGAPVLGTDAYTSDWNGAKLQFASAENKAMFDAEPDKFAPQYGGYCAYALSKNAIAKTSPDAWTVADSKLYLNYDTSVREIWRQDQSGNIARADQNWPTVLSR